MSVYDSRSLDKNRQVNNRKRYMERNKQEIKRKVDAIINGSRRIKDADKGGTVPVADSDAHNPLDYSQHNPRKIVVPGNDKYNKSDRIGKPKNDGYGKGSAGGEGDDEFDFNMTKEEFIEFYFEDMELPDMVKQQLKSEVRFILKTGGYTKDGIPPRLSIKKTFQNAIARRLANKAEGHKSPFLDDVDLRYIRKYRVPVPYTKAAMICLMDVSGSMSEEHKNYAKHFYVLLYLFLTKFYTDIELIFIRYHTYTRETDEDDFFHARDTGGTNVLVALDFVQDLIATRFDLSKVNLYMAHASDGDLGYDDKPITVGAKLTELAPHFQYMSYVDILRRQYGYASDPGLLGVYQKIALPNSGMAEVNKMNEIYPALRSLFEKKKGVKT